MAQSPTISIPKKKTDEVDWAPHILKIIAQSYGENPDNYAAECAALQRCRQDAVRGAGSDITARDLLYKYFGQLELLELRFAEIRVPFPWHDAFTSKLTTQTSLAFEKASIIFQIASTHSTLAFSANRSDPEGLKRAFHYFRTAAGMLTYINDNFLHAPSTDLSKEVVKFLVGIMLAQATEVFFEKLVSEKKANSMITKVAAQAAFLYTGLTEEVKDFLGKGIFDRNWVSLLQIKAKYFSSLSHYFRSLVDSASGSHGESLTRLIVAENLAKEAHRLSTSFGPYFISTMSPSLPPDTGTAIVELTKAHLTLVSEKRTTGQKDNDLIYNAILPSEATLPPIDKLSVATAIPIQEVYGTPEVQKVIGADIFIKLIPLSVHESASVYSEEKAKLVRAEVERAETADTDLRIGLDSLGLPKGLGKWKELVTPDADGGYSVVPKQVEVWADEIRRADGAIGVEKLLNQLERLKGEVGNTLGTIERDLERESKDCEAMRVKYEHLWTQAPSASLTRALRQDLKSHTDAFHAASSSDAQVYALWENTKPDLSLLLAGSDTLERFFAEQEIKGGSGGNLLDIVEDDSSASKEGLDEIAKKVDEIEERIGRANKIKRERGEVLKDLKEKIQADDVSHLLLLHRRSTTGEPSLFAQELEKFRPYQTRLAATIHHQEATLDEIGSLWKALQTGNGRDWVRKAEIRDKKKGDGIARLAYAREGWAEVREGLGKGIQFYRDLSELVDALQRNVSSFVHARNTERDTLVSQAETSRRLSAPSSTPLVPQKPPLPPPPPPSTTRGITSSLASLNLSYSSSQPPSLYSNSPNSPTTQSSSFYKAPSPPRAPPPSSSYSPYPPQPPPQPQRPPQSPNVYSNQQTSYSSLPPPPAQSSGYNYPSAPSAPSSDPYAQLFGAQSPSLPSQFAIDSNRPQAPPPQPQYQRQQPQIYPPPPQPIRQSSYPPALSNPQYPQSYPQTQPNYGYSSPPPPTQQQQQQQQQQPQQAPFPPPPHPLAYQSQPQPQQYQAPQGANGYGQPQQPPYYGYGR